MNTELHNVNANIKRKLNALKREKDELKEAELDSNL